MMSRIANTLSVYCMMVNNSEPRVVQNLAAFALIFLLSMDDLVS